MFAHPVCRNVFCIAIAALLAAACDRVGASEFVFVRDGQPAATIVTAAAPSDAAAFAAQELQYHVWKITGTMLPIKSDADKVEGARILIGPSAAAAQFGVEPDKFKDQEYLIRFVDNALILLGKDAASRKNVEAAKNWFTSDGVRLPPPPIFDEQATSYAVHDFLERFCGVRWFGPGELEMVLPKTATLAVPSKDIRRTPAFAFRQPCGPQNIIINQWNKPSQQDINLFWSRLRVGGEKYACNHSFYGYYDRFWKKNPKCPETFVAAHPEWFAQGYSESELKALGGQPPQMCYSSQGFIDQVAADARKFFDGEAVQSGVQASNANQSLGQFFGLVPMDSTGWCKCPVCQAQLTRQRNQQEFSNGVASDYFFAFANKVAREVAKTHPGKTLATLAYSEYAYHPQKVRLEPNISVQLCLHARHQWVPGMKANDLNFYRNWVSNEQGRRLYVWLYYCFPEFTWPFHCFPGFSAHNLDTQFKQFARDGIRGAFFNNTGEQVDIYVSLKLLDDPSLNMDAMLDDFFTRYYGPAGPALKTFYLRVEETYSDPANYPEEVRKKLDRQFHQTEEMAWKYLGTEARMAELGKLMDEAEKANTSALEKQRVALFRKAIYDYMVEGRRQYLAKQPKPAPATTPAKNGLGN